MDIQNNNPLIKTNDLQECKKAEGGGGVHPFGSAGSGDGQPISGAGAQQGAKEQLAEPPLCGGGSGAAQGSLRGKAAAGGVGEQLKAVQDGMKEGKDLR